MKPVFKVLGLLASMAMAGCSSSGGFPDNPVSARDERPLYLPYFRVSDPQTDNDGNLVRGTDGKIIERSKIAQYNAVTGSTAADEDKRKFLRNEIIYGRIAAYDLEFAEFQQGVFRERSITASTADITVAALGGLGATLASATTKTALAASSAVVTGAKGSIDKNLFYDQTLSALFTQMNASRTRILVNIDKSAGLPTTLYPLTRGLIDTTTYREAGSVPGAITNINNTAGMQKSQAITEFDALQAKRLGQ